MPIKLYFYCGWTSLNFDVSYINTIIYLFLKNFQSSYNSNYLNFQKGTEGTSDFGNI